MRNESNDKHEVGAFNSYLFFTGRSLSTEDCQAPPDQPPPEIKKATEARWPLVLVFFSMVKTHKRHFYEEGVFFGADMT